MYANLVVQFLEIGIINSLWLRICQLILIMQGIIISILIVVKVLQLMVEIFYWSFIGFELIPVIDSRDSLNFLVSYFMWSYLWSSSSTPITEDQSMNYLDSIINQLKKFLTNLIWCSNTPAKFFCLLPYLITTTIGTTKIKVFQYIQDIVY